MKTSASKPYSQHKSQKVKSEFKAINLFIALLVFTVVFVVVVLVLLNSETNQPFPGKRRRDSPDKIFYKFVKGYQKRLSNIPVPKYKDSNAFVDHGPPPARNNSLGSSRIKTILTWTKFFGTVNWMPGTVTCPGVNISCRVSTDKEDLLVSDAVVFHAIDIKTYPQQRLPHQRWIYLVQKPPYLVKAYAKRNFDKYNGIFNWTATYRWDSDFPALLYNASLLRKPLSVKEYQQTFGNITRKKQKLLAFMHRQCNPQSPGFKILAEIRKYLPVDVYGACGNLSCPWNTAECKNKMSAYKFYLSFENSECREHISHQVRLPLQEWQAVPVVFGAHPQDYIKALPPNSFIHAKGFNSIKQLAEFIRLLDKHLVLYEKYHTWRKRFNGTVGLSSCYCGICKALHNQTLPTKIYRDFKGWYEEDACWRHGGNKVS